MYEISFVAFGKYHGAVIDTRQSAFNVYYMAASIAAECSGDWFLQLIDLETGKIVIECDSDSMW